MFVSTTRPDSSRDRPDLVATLAIADSVYPDFDRELRVARHHGRAFSRLRPAGDRRRPVDRRWSGARLTAIVRGPGDSGPGGDAVIGVRSGRSAQVSLHHDLVRDQPEHAQSANHGGFSERQPLDRSLSGDHPGSHRVHTAVTAGQYSIARVIFISDQHVASAREEGDDDGAEDDDADLDGYPRHRSAQWNASADASNHPPPRTAIRFVANRALMIESYPREQTRKHRRRERSSTSVRLGTSAAPPPPNSVTTHDHMH